MDQHQQALTNALNRRNAIWAELATTAWGANVSEQGRTIDQVGYRKSLLDELDQLNKQIATLAWMGGETVYSVVRLMNPVRIAFDSQTWIPWTEPVAVTSVRPTGGNVTAADVPAGVYQQGTAESAPSRGVALALDIVVTVGLCDVPFEPLPWDQVSWRGKVYTVQRTNASRWLRFRTLWCKDLVLANRLVQTGSILRAEDTADPGGKRIPVLSTALAAVPCRVQPIAGVVGENMEALTTKATYRAYLGQQVYPKADDVFQVGDQRYSVVGWGDAELLDRLPYLDLVDIDQGTP